MNCCTGIPARASAAQSPSLHVNYTKGMVLGVDDFTQEFAYLSGRDQWIVRELSGAGVLRGLAVTAEDTANGPRIRVARGSAATASGKLVCVPADQCGTLNAWLAVKENADAVTRLLGTGSPPAPPPPVSPPAILPLYVTLCYAECLTAPVPIPGEPCRSDDTLMANSRVADDFRIELRTAAPDRAADDGLRAFVAWLRQVPIADTSPPPPDEEAQWLAELRAAAPSWYPGLPPAPGISPPLPFVSRSRWPDFLRFAFRFWVTEIAPRIGPVCGDAPRAEADCLLLARLDVPVLFAGGVPSGAWQVAGLAAAIGIRQSDLTPLLPTRLLEEWLLSEPPGGDALPRLALPQPLHIAARPTFAELTLSGAVRLPFVTTDAELALSEQHYCVACTAAVTLRLPKAGPSLAGRIYVLKALVGDCTIAAAAGDTVEGAALRPLAGNAALTLICDGASAWLAIGSFSS